MKSKLKIAFISSEDPHDKKAWSGTFYQIFNALKEEFEIVDPIFYNSNISKVLGLINKITVPLINKKYNHQNSIFRAYIQSKGIQKQLNNKEYDILFCCVASTEIAYLNTNIPIYYFSDTSFAQFANYYDVVENLFSFSLKESNYIENKALQKAYHVIYPTQWAKNFTIKHYQLDKNKISNFHLGANLDESFIKYIPKKYDLNRPFNILFLGVFWERKGGDIVLETYKRLLEKNKNIHLTICGTIPPENIENITVIPFLDKNNLEDLKKLNQILQNTHLLFVPTRAECYGIVFNEAAAYGIPVLSSKTGGVPEIVINDFNGYTLPLDNSAVDYTEIIIKLLNNPNLYKSLSINARNKYTEENNWMIFGEKIRNIIENNK